MGDKEKNDQIGRYCILPSLSFDINMPLLYGEGDRVFILLQETIFKPVSNHSIFAWGNGNQNDIILASHLSVFSNDGEDLEGDWGPSLLARMSNSRWNNWRSTSEELLEPCTVMSTSIRAQFLTFVHPRTGTEGAVLG